MKDKSEVARKTWADPEIRAKRQAGMSRAMTQRWQDPVKRKILLDAQRNGTVSDPWGSFRACNERACARLNVPLVVLETLTKLTCRLQSIGLNLRASLPETFQELVREYELEGCTPGVQVKIVGWKMEQGELPHLFNPNGKRGQKYLFPLTGRIK